MDLEDMQKLATDNAVKHGWIITHDNLPTYLLLVVTEISEAMEKYRDGEPMGEELADAVIRIGHISGAIDINLNEHVIAKMARNLHRPYKHGHKVL